ncbi:MAG TPA: AraC family transcriptional regulator [Candidatus Limnocylindrales bacterium]|nr:AraC family transcriptional regulator [Candidatus Limnocylindrales bacterium]
MIEPAIRSSAAGRAVESRQGVRFTAGDFIPRDSIVGCFPAHHFRSIPWHDHDFYELAIVQAGTGVHAGDEEAVPLTPGTVVFVPPGVGHEYRDCPDMHVLNWFFRAEVLDVELLWARHDPLLGQLLDPDRRAGGGHRAAPLVTALDPESVQRVHEALDPIRTGGATSRPAQIARLLLALEVVARAAARDVRPCAPGSPPLVVAHAVELMRSDLAHPWTLEELSHRTFVNRFHLARIFSRTLGVPPMHYLSRLRAERAATMLATTDLAVGAIGALVGWADPAYFSRRFRAAFGTCPSRYRRERSVPGHRAAELPTTSKN